MITETKVIFMTLFYSFLKNYTAPQQVIFSGKLSTVIIFKLCKFNVNLWTLWGFFSYKKYIGCRGRVDKNTELKLWCFCSAECGFESRS